MVKESARHLKPKRWLSGGEEGEGRGNKQKMAHVVSNNLLSCRDKKTSNQTRVVERQVGLANIVKICFMCFRTVEKGKVSRPGWLKRTRTCRGTEKRALGQRGRF